MNKMHTGVSGKLWATFLPLASPTPDGARPRGISIAARDLQSVVFYDAGGQFVGVRRPGSGKPIEVEGVSIVVDNVIGSTGVEIKADPGIPLVYAGKEYTLRALHCLLIIIANAVWG